MKSSVSKYAKLAFVAGAFWLVVSLCSCSASKNSALTTTAQSGVSATLAATAHRVTADSLHRESVNKLFRDRSLELTDVTIEYATPRKRTRWKSASTPTAPPAKLSIGKISARENTAAARKVSSDSIGKRDLKSDCASDANRTTLNSQLSTPNVQPKTLNTWGRIVLIFAIILGLGMGYMWHRHSNLKK